jgi:hypothetical protein
MPTQVVLLVAIIFPITVAWRAGGESEAPGKEDATLSAHFVDGRWLLRTDRACFGDEVTNPSLAQIPEADYRPLSKGPTYPIVVSKAGSLVEIGGTRRLAVHPPMKGSRSASGDSIVFDLQEGTFAGGRFVVWSTKQGLQAELTIYGSGVPIISSERGALLRSQ